MKMNVLYWSASGNTQMMAETLASSAREAGAQVFIQEVSKANANEALLSDILALGSPAMGAEVIEEEEMEPFVSALEKKGLSGKKLLLFGSYDWGDGEWMRDWQDRMKAAGAILLCEDLIAHNAPDEDDLNLLSNAAKKAVATLS
ncbi:MAG TPA: flavodoxin [Treponemataceae bacterium]|nr:flavodoxin [Treponemataceae bacterium]